MADTLKDYYRPVIADAFDSSRGAWKFQTFTTTSAYSLDRITLKLKFDGAPSSRDYYVRLYAVDGSHMPTGAVLAEYGSFDPTVDLTASYAEYNFSGDSYSVSNNTEYAIVVQTDDTFTSSQWSWYTDATAGYASGICAYGNHTGWATITNDRWFETYEAGGTVYAEGTKTVTAAASVSLVAGPGKATDPVPSDDQGNVLIAGLAGLDYLEWTAPVGETPDYLVYFRPEGATWTLYSTITDDSERLAVPIALSYYSTYEWRVDTRDRTTLLETTGDTWTFVTQPSPSFTDYTRPSAYDPDLVWQPGTGWVDINSFEFTGGGRYKNRVVVVGHKVVYFGDL